MTACLRQVTILCAIQAPRNHSTSISRNHWNALKPIKASCLGWQIFVTDKVTGGWETYRDIVAANGGTCKLYKGKRYSNVGRRVKEEPKNAEEEALTQNMEEDDGETAYLISGTHKDEVRVWANFKEMVNSADMRPRIVKPDWLLQVAMSQRFQWDPQWELSEDD